jgi:hypothetical protein
MQNERPIGVSLIAILAFLGGALIILLSLCTLFTPIPGGASIVPILIGLLWLALGVFYIAMGWGLWELRDWARIAVIVLQALNLIGGLILGAIFLFGIDISALDPYLGTFGGTLSFPGIGIGFWVGAAISGVIIWYLLTPEVQAAFGAGVEAYYPPPSPPPPVYPAPLPSTEVASPPPALVPSHPAAPPVDPTQLMGEKQPVQGWLVVRSGPRAGKQLGLSASARNTLGRDGTRCDLILDDRAASAEHARVQWEHGQFVLYDLASTNGTWVNNRRVQRQTLMDDDVIRIGDTTMVFKSVR